MQQCDRIQKFRQTFPPQHSSKHIALLVKPQPRVRINITSNPNEIGYINTVALAYVETSDTPTFVPRVLFEVKGSCI